MEYFKIMSSRICRNKKGFEAVTTNEGEYLDRRKSKRRKRKDFLKKTTVRRSFQKRIFFLFQKIEFF